MSDVLLFDGAFGTYYHALHGSAMAPELANLHRKNAVYEIHREYLAAGAQAIKTNTFAANSALSTDSSLLGEIIKNGYETAVLAAGGSERVFADIGPIRSENAAYEYGRITEQFLSLGASNFLFETQQELEPLKASIRRIQAVRRNARIFVSFAVSLDGYTKAGGFYKTLIAEALAAGADYAGMNCICGPAHMLELIQDLDVEAQPLLAMPNSSYPSMVNGRTAYIDNPDYFSDYLVRLYQCGVNVLGGCCGTTPNHIRAAAEKLRAASGIKRLPVRKKAEALKTAEPKGFLTEDRKMIAAELSPPIDTDMTYLLGAAERLKACGADYITVPDSPLAKPRASSVMTAARIQREIGIETIPHVACRDRNRIALQGELLSGNMEGLRNILALTGDPIPDTARDGNPSVFGFNSFRLMEFVRALNSDLFADSPYRICGVLNLNARNFDVELRRAEEKIRNGATVLFTQPVFTRQNAENLTAARQSLSCMLMAGIMPVASYRNALFLNNEVAGIEVPARILTLLKDKNAEETKEISVGFCRQLIDRVYDSCDGFYLITPLKKLEFTEMLIEYIRGKEQ